MVSRAEDVPTAESISQDISTRGRLRILSIFVDRARRRFYNSGVVELCPPGPVDLPEETRSTPPLIETNRIERLGRRERAILVGVILPHTDALPEDPLDELRGLAKTAGLHVVGSLLQKRPQIDIATYIGSGKVEELKAIVEAQEADLVVF